MKQTILSFAIVAAAVATTAQAQTIKAYTGTTATAGQTIIKGSWKVSTDPKGNMVITDEANNVLRMVAAENTNSVSLSIDKAGNLHVENVASAGSFAKNDQGVAERSTWADPDKAETPRAEPLAVTVKSTMQAH